MDKIPLIAVVGATASGKTALAVELAKRFGGEVISADSMQIYKGMDIATAKPTEEEKQNIPHHLIDFLPVTENYSVAAFVRDANAAADGIVARGNIPVLAGGTGLYIDSLTDNIVFEDEPDHSEFRARLEKRKNEEGIGALFDELRRVDPETADSLHINNEKRILRALEVFYLTGETLSARRARSRSVPSRFNTVFIQPDYADRNVLYERIDLRVDRMLERGLVEEARAYYSLKDAVTASQAIGYKELKGYFEGTLTLAEAAGNLKQATRRYAKRQLTWFRRNERIRRILCDECSSFEEIAEKAGDIVKKSGILTEGEAEE